MAGKKSVVPVADVLKAIKTFEKATGLKVTAVKHHPDGTFRLMTAEHSGKKTAANDDEPTLAGWDDVVPHAQA